MPCTLELEKKAGENLYVAGVDEVGRGPLAGPVLACAVVLPCGFRLKGLNDSKQLTALQRERFYEVLTTSEKIHWAVAWRDNRDIDRLNILRATHEVMREAVTLLPIPADHALVDGRPVPQFPIPHTAVVGGDKVSLSIAAASVIAKVTRDRFMQAADVRYPEYGFRDHKGYTTPQHLRQLRKYGPCPLHRFTFAPVAQGELPFD
ncbi:MAG: ribonuclease HII [Verrucomicrobia bacterium]|nr:MAG: ribonuclease HII [Verrucomicrobiota bacterium]